LFASIAAAQTSTVPTNAALMALSTATTSSVIRLGFNAPGDAPAIFYNASTGACSLNSGAGDNGSQVQSADSNCWLANFPTRELDVHEWGVAGTGSDDTVALQAAINYAETAGYTLYFSPGTYEYSSLSVTGSVHFKGASRRAVSFYQNSATNTGIVVNTVLPVFFEGIGFSQQMNPTNGAAISLSAPSSYNQGSIFRDLDFSGNYVGIDTIAASSWVIDSDIFSQYVAAGAIVQNTSNVDAGDSIIANSTFASSVANSVSVSQYSSGGLKIIGDKLIGGGYGYLMQLAPGASTSDLVIVGDSIEGQSSAAIQITRQTSSGTFANVVISGDQIAPSAGANPISMGDATPGWLSAVTITGDTVNVNSGTAIKIGSVAVFNAGGNNLLSQGGTTTGISIGSGATNGSVGLNTYNSITTPVMNNSASTTVASRKYTQVVNVVCSTPVGSSYSGSLPVTLPAGMFQGTPVIDASVTGGTASIGAGGSASSPISATITATAATASAVVQVTYTASAPY
jgi:hypothetical protein